MSKLYVSVPLNHELSFYGKMKQVEFENTQEEKKEEKTFTLRRKLCEC